MSLANLALLIGATISATGGTAKSFAPNGPQTNNTIRLVDTSATDFRTQAYIIAKQSWPVLGGDNKYRGKIKQSVQYVQPRIKADGTIGFDSVKNERSMDIEATAAELLELTKVGAQLYFDADVLAFWATGSTA